MLSIRGRVVLGQSKSIDWFELGGGGGTSSGGAYIVSGTVGQAVVGRMSGDKYALDTGSWSLIEVIQSGPAPVLSVVRSGPSVTITWPSASLGFVLQQSPDLNANHWSAYAGSVADNGIIRSITVLAGTGSLFLRLEKIPQD